MSGSGDMSGGECPGGLIPPYRCSTTLASLNDRKDRINPRQRTAYFIALGKNSCSPSIL